MKHLLLAFIALVYVAQAAPAETLSVITQANVAVELTFSAKRQHADPFKDVILDVLFTQPDGKSLRVPAFWAGGDQWKVRYASPQIGAHSWKSECLHSDDPGLDGQSGVVEISNYTGDNPLFKHGPIGVAADKRHFQYADGTPFFWLADTWWMGLSKRLHWPEEFQQLTADRKQKGFNVVQIVAGLYPDMPPFDPRGENEAGCTWEKDYARIRPEYFDAADRRLRFLVDQGISPCIVGGWGYFLPLLGAEKAKAHWRYLIARYGAWPVIWCAAGEANLPYYLAKGFPFDDRQQASGWSDVMRSIRATDPWRRLITVHPTAINRYTARHVTDDEGLLDFDMLQTPHGQAEAAPVAIRAVRDSYAAQPTMPVIDGEASYEMLADNLPTAWTRAMFWLCVTNGAAGHTYGANGIWQLNRKGDPHGASPHGGTYGKISWDEAMRLPGSEQVAQGKKFLESLPWTKLTPRPEAVTWASEDRPLQMGHWIWFPEGNPRRNAPVATRFFRREFKVPENSTIRRATLSISADDKFTAWLNGKQVGASDSWRKPLTIDVAADIRAGQNVLAVKGENCAAPVAENPAGLIAGLEIEISTATTAAATIHVVTDATWRTSQTEQPGWREARFDDSTWAAAAVVAALGDTPWGNIAGQHSEVGPQACVIGDRLMLIYALNPQAVIAHDLRPNAKYRLAFFDPVTGQQTTDAVATTDSRGECRMEPPQPTHDWVVVLDAQ